MSDTKLNERLCSAASFVRQRAVLADIGTDHAYLPIFLLSSGHIERAYATDINRGPLISAEENIRQAGLLSRCELVLSDGATALSGLGITDYTVCGMGGELIASIIERAPHLFDMAVRLILQPMSRQHVLRKYLLEKGFSIKAEAYSRDAGKYYVSMMVEYTGIKKVISERDSHLPCTDTQIINKEAERGYLLSKLRAYKKAARGKMLGGCDTPHELEYIEFIEKYLEG